MTILEILKYPDKRLHLKAKPVTEFNDKLSKLINAMANTMYHSNGIGLAAIQVNVQQMIFIVDISRNDEPKNLLSFINPIIIAKEGNVISEEGCLSVPDIFEKVPRYESITLRYQDVKGNIYEQSFTGLMAICIQHELDHLHGKVFVEYLSHLKQNYIQKKLKKLYKPQ